MLVTGGTGFTGAHLVQSLTDDGFTVRVITRSKARGESVLPSGTELLEGEVSDRSVVERAVEGCGYVFHLATTFREAGLPDGQHQRTHVRGTKILLAASKRAGVRRLVHCSTVGVHGHVPNPPASETFRFSPGDIYQETKLEAERDALRFFREEGLSVAVARPTPIYGPGDLRLLKLFRMVQRRRFLMLGDGRVFYHLVYVDDLVRGLRILGTHTAAEGEAFILGGPECPTLNELVDSIGREMGVEVSRFHFPAKPFQLAGSLCEALCRPFGVVPPIYRRRVDFFTKSRAFDISKAESELGFKPLVGLKEGIRRTLAWYQESGKLQGPRRER